MVRLGADESVKGTQDSFAVVGQPFSLAKWARTYLGGGKPALSEKAVPESPPAGFGTPVAFPTLAPAKEWSTVTVAVAPAEVAVNNDAARTTDAVIGLTVVSFSRSVQLRRSV